MKGQSTFGQFLLAGAVCSVLLMSAVTSSAQIYTFTRGINTVAGTDEGMVDWKVNGVDYLNLQAFFVRMDGATAETQLTSGTYVPPMGTRPPSITYSSIPNLRVGNTMTFTGSGSSGILNQTIALANTSATETIKFSFFLYSDFNLPGAAGSDSVAINPATGNYANATQISANGSSVRQDFQLNTIAYNVFPAHIEATLDPAGLLASLKDGGVTTLSDLRTAGMGDAAWVLQWDLELKPQDGDTISLLYVAVPEPSICAFGLVGALAVMLRRRLTLG